MARSFAAVFIQRTSKSSGPHFKSDADLSRIVFSEVNAGLLEGFLYFDDGGEISFHNPLGLFDAPQSCQADAGPAGKLVLAPAQKRTRRSDLSRISHCFAMFPDSIPC